MIQLLHHSFLNYFRTVIFFFQKNIVTSWICFELFEVETGDYIEKGSRKFFFVLNNTTHFSLYMVNYKM